jgi:hypothetical protein
MMTDLFWVRLGVSSAQCTVRVPFGGRRVLDLEPRLFVDQPQQHRDRVHGTVSVAQQGADPILRKVGLFDHDMVGRFEPLELCSSQVKHLKTKK